jgi:hypothetical protein
MTNKPNVNNEPELEDINSKLFSSFDPDQELWILGGSDARTNTTGSGTVTGTFNGVGFDADADADVDF